MGEDRRGTPRTLRIADHLWEAFAIMAAEMGSDREALVNQALYTFARLNGFALAFEAGGPREDAGRVAEIAQQIAATGLSRQLSTPPPPLQRAEPSDACGALATDDMAHAVVEVAALEPPITSLVLSRKGGEVERVIKDRFLIGRGKHCDLVIHSSKVSREHAAIVRNGTGWFIEDLGSSNGTWFEQRRIGRRRIEEGDEYSICSEKLRCSLR